MCGWKDWHTGRLSGLTNVRQSACDRPRIGRQWNFRVCAPYSYFVLLPKWTRKREFWRRFYMDYAWAQVAFLFRNVTISLTTSSKSIIRTNHSIYCLIKQIYVWILNLKTVHRYWYLVFLKIYFPKEHLLFICLWVC